jgi:hypothetical protein
MKGKNWEVIVWSANITDDNKVKRIRNIRAGELLLKVYDDDKNYYASVACKNDDAAENAHDCLSANYGSTYSTLDGKPFIG